MAVGLLPVLLLAGCDAVHRAAPADQPAVLEVAIFEGGYGIDWHQRVAAQYSALPGTPAIDLWGDPRIREKVRPRLLRGDPPDLLLMHDLPVWLLIESDKLLPFDPLLDAPLADGIPWRDHFIEGALDTYTTGGKTYGIPSAFGAWACWYDARLFREHGWEPPRTWEEFHALCEEIRAAGIAPLAFQGKYPVYGWYSLVSLIQRSGGLAAVNRINAMEAGAFSHPDVVRAAALLQHLAQEHFQKGALAMTHTEGQLQFINNSAAMIFCGLWLYNEMRESIPPGFEMRCFTMPEMRDGKGNPKLFSGDGTEFLFVPSEAAHPAEGMEFARFMVSPEQAADLAASINVISPLKGATPKEAVAPPLASALEMIRSAEGAFNIRLPKLLLEWNNQVMLPGTGKLLAGELTPEAYCALLDAGVAAALADADEPLPEPVLYDPAAFGEAP